MPDVAVVARVSSVFGAVKVTAVVVSTMAPCIDPNASSDVGGIDMTCPARGLEGGWCGCPVCPSPELVAPGVFMGITGTTPSPSFQVNRIAASALPLESGMTLANPPQFSISCEFSLCVGVFLDRP